MARSVQLKAGDVAAHLTLKAGEATAVIFPDDLEHVEIMARDGAADIWYTLDKRTPVAAGAHCYLLPAGAVGADTRQPLTAGPTTVTLLAHTATQVTVQRGSGA